MKLNKKEHDFYSFKTVSNLLEDDEINEVEEGFMRGYLASD